MKIRKAKKSELKEIALLMKKELGKPPYNEKESINNVIKSLAFYFKIGEIYVYLIEKEIAGVVVFKIEQYWEGKVFPSLTSEFKSALTKTSLFLKLYDDRVGSFILNLFLYTIFMLTILLNFPY